MMGSRIALHCILVLFVIEQSKSFSVPFSLGHEAPSHKFPSFAETTEWSTSASHLATSKRSTLDRRSLASDFFLNVMDYGAKGDGKTDDTKAFVNALQDASTKLSFSLHRNSQIQENAGGTVVFVPAGDYLITGTLSIPDSTSLEGVNVAPPRARGGSTLLTTAGEGQENGTPFISLGTDSAVSSLVIFYPNQSYPNLQSYPWTIRATGDDATLLDILIINPWQAVDFGTITGGRHYIKGLYAQPLHTGLYIDNTFDVGRVEDVHFWPFWSTAPAIMNYTATHATAFVIGRTDWEYMVNCFAINHKIGFHFIAGPNGPGNVLLVNSGADEPGISVVVEHTESHAGISFVNGQFMGGIIVASSNEGPVKFTNCGFWGVPQSTDSHAIIAGQGHVTFIGCHFIWWAQKNSNAAAITATGPNVGLTVQGCDFMDTNHNQISVDSAVQAALIIGNRCRGGIRITNNAGAHAVIANNLGY